MQINVFDSYTTFSIEKSKNRNEKKEQTPPDIPSDGEEQDQ